MRHAHPVSHVHRREPAGRLGGGPEATAQVRNSKRGIIVVVYSEKHWFEYFISHLYVAKKAPIKILIFILIEGLLHQCVGV